MPPLSITAGSLLVATPLYIANVFISSGFPEAIPMRSLYSIIYLAVVGSAIGFPLYFYLLTQISATKLALIALITPVTALLLGAWLNDEQVNTQVWLGTALILGGLAMYQFGHRISLKNRFTKRLQFWWKQRPM